MTITSDQMRASRGLVKMTVEQLAAHIGVNRDTIDDFEAGITRPQRKTMQKIQDAMETLGVEFLDFDGVRRKPHGVDILVGTGGLQRFFDGVYEYSRQHGGTIVQFGVDEKLFLDHLGVEFSADYVRRMQELSDQRRDLSVLAIIKEGETDYLAPDYNEYRWISKDVFEAVPFYIYGDTLAIMDFYTDPAPTIVLLRFTPITNAYRKQFNAFWSMAKPMPERRK